MKVAILAGGVGSRLSEETETKPKPMVEIGGRPILWHIMRYYAHFGLNRFAIALGYKGEVIKKYMVDYASLHGDLTVDMHDGSVRRHGNERVNWTLELIDTGIETQTGGRIRRLAPALGNETFLLVYGDGLSTIDPRELIAFHNKHGKLATVAAVRPPARFGHFEFDGDRVAEFSEKPQTGEGWINGAVFVLEPGVFDYIDGDHTPWERQPMENLALDGQLMAFRHGGFWQCMDTLRDRVLLESLWAGNQAPWKVW
jgi:glucose-1-phosphate cytidylyltransferase